jgi:hypothetical protein
MRVACAEKLAVWLKSSWSLKMRIRSTADYQLSFIIEQQFCLHHRMEKSAEMKRRAQAKVSLRQT